MHDLSDGFALRSGSFNSKAIPNFNSQKPSITGGLEVNGRDVMVKWKFPIRSYLHIDNQPFPRMRLLATSLGRIDALPHCSASRITHGVIKEIT